MITRLRRGLILGILGMLSSRLLGAESKEVAFWTWFQTNQDRLFSFEQDREKRFDELTNALRKVDENLTFEFGPVTEDHKREFVVSADGIRSSFPAVQALVAAAPKLDRWIVVAFRPARALMIPISFQGKTVKAGEVRYLLVPDQDPGKAGIVLFLKGYRESEKNTFGAIGYLFLDDTLGEYTVETRLGAIEFRGEDSELFARAHPLSGLAADFSSRFKTP